MAQDINVNITNGVTEVNGVVPDINGVITIETGDIPESTDANFVSDAQLTVIGNTSGTNTGDETDTTIKTKLGITTLSGSNTGDQDLSGYQVTSAKNQPSGYLGITAGNIVQLPNGMGFISLNVTPNQIAYFDAFGNLLTLSTATYPSIAQLAHVKGVTSAIQTQLDAKNPSTTATTGSVISFATPQVYNTFDTPSTANLTDDLTGAKIGVVQKIYSNKAVAPTVPAGWVLIGTGTYTTSVLNIIFAEWVSTTRVEYWITKPA